MNRVEVNGGCNVGWEPQFLLQEFTVNFTVLNYDNKALLAWVESRNLYLLAETRVFSLIKVQEWETSASFGAA